MVPMQRQDARPLQNTASRSRQERVLLWDPHLSSMRGLPSVEDCSTWWSIPNVMLVSLCAVPCCLFFLFRDCPPQHYSDDFRGGSVWQRVPIILPSIVTWCLRVGWTVLARQPGGGSVLTSQGSVITGRPGTEPVRWYSHDFEWYRRFTQTVSSL